jgi:hypothetical protein
LQPWERAFEILWILSGGHRLQAQKTLTHLLRCLVTLAINKQ